MVFTKSPSTFRRIITWVMTYLWDHNLRLCSSVFVPSDLLRKIQIPRETMFYLIENGYIILYVHWKLGSPTLQKRRKYRVKVAEEQDTVKIQHSVSCTTFGRWIKIFKYSRKRLDDTLNKCTYGQLYSYPVLGFHSDRTVGCMSGVSQKVCWWTR